MSTLAGSQQNKDERFFFRVLIAASLVLGAGFCLLLLTLNRHEREMSADESPPRLIPPDHPRQLVNFSLTDRTGRTVTRSELAGKILVVDFLFTSCSVTCPVVNGQMARIQQLATNQPDVELVSLTVDPRDDTIEALTKYGERFRADTNRWLLLTGDKAKLYGLIATSFLNQDLADALNDAGTDPSRSQAIAQNLNAAQPGQSHMPGNFSHTERIALVDAQGQLRGYFDGLNPMAAEAVVEEIGRLRK